MGSEREADAANGVNLAGTRLEGDGQVIDAQRLGIQPPNVSLGLLVDQGQDSATTEWWLFVFPVAFLIILILSIFLIGDGLREAFDPKKSRVRA